jgi:flagellar hook assembly protein FlgD
LRKPAIALALTLIATLAIAVPSVAAIGSGAKVVIIVGATEGTTSSYRQDADQIYATATQYTSNVVKVYSPNATWARVKAAVTGASIVVYLGHGNGWPSPYTFDPTYKTKDGFGLNATEGAGDSNRVYYGEPYIATLALAPGAIVILNHLCYASGNSESGAAEPTVTVARQRVDNYASAFLRAGAAAVIADGHNGVNGYIRDLFTTSQSIESLWANQYGANGNIVSFPSVRTPGATAYQDPRTPTSGFYRSLVVRSASAMNEGVATNAGDTSVDPASLTVPGNAAVSTEAAALFGDPTLGSAPVRTLAAGTRLRLVGGPVGLSAQSIPMVQVQGLDDPGIAGFVETANLAPRDSTPPAVTGLQLAADSISPNGDGIGDLAVVTGQLSEPASWTATITGPAGNVLFEQAGLSPAFQFAWNPLASGQPVLDGSYLLSISAVDAWQNRGADTRRTIAVDTSPARLVALTPAPTAISTFSPNGDGYRDTVAFTATTAEPGTLQVGVRNAYGATLKTWAVPTSGAPTSVTWDGRDGAGNLAPDGRYVVAIAPADASGAVGGGQERTVALATALASVTSSVPVFYPQDGDALAPTTTLSFTLTRPMTVTWTLRDAAARVIDTHLAATALPVGTQSWLFDGRRSDGTMLPPGRYLSYVTASDGSVVVAQSVAVEADAFLVKPSDATPGRGQTITIEVTSAEPLSTNPRLSVYEPGIAAWSATLKRVSANGYRVTLKMRTGGRVGTVTFRVTGVDATGATQRTTRAYPLH